MQLHTPKLENENAKKTFYRNAIPLQYNLIHVVICHRNIKKPKQRGQI